MSKESKNKELKIWWQIKFKQRNVGGSVKRRLKEIDNQTNDSGGEKKKKIDSS